MRRSGPSIAGNSGGRSMTSAEDRIHFAGPTAEEQAAEAFAHAQKYRTQKVAELTRAAWAHHQTWVVCRAAKAVISARDERALAWDCIARAKALRIRVQGAYFA